MTKCYTLQLGKNGEAGERALEIDCFLSVLADIKRKHINMFELGAGWGEWCLALAGVIDYKLVPITPASYACLAVEGEPTHCQWAREHFEAQNINATVVQGAISDKNGKCWFDISPKPDSWYGQSITFNTKFHRFPILKTLWGLSELVRKRTARIPMYTIDYLMEAYKFDHIDLIDMDVQGAEYKVMLGATESIRNGLIDYLLVGTHSRDLNEALRQLLTPKFDSIIDIYPNSVGVVDGFAPVKCQDGIQLWKRKNMS